MFTGAVCAERSRTGMAAQAALSPPGKTRDPFRVFRAVAHAGGQSLPFVVGGKTT